MDPNEEVEEFVSKCYADYAHTYRMGKFLAYQDDETDGLVMVLADGS